MSRPILLAKDVNLAFGGVIAADHINFELNEGERLAVIGQNGAGKTTFINICTGYLKPTSGQILFNGTDITGKTPRSIVRLGLGRSFQLPQLFVEHTVQECLEIAAAARNGNLSLLKSLSASVDRHEIIETMELVGLRDKANEISGALPEGHKKLLDVAMALMLRPKLIIMDEPTSGVSSEDKHDLMALVMQALEERKVTSWFVEHDVDIVSKYATRVAAWISGKIAADGSPDEVLKNLQVRKEVLGDLTC
ncbi:ATP-binding cassette domain-containing protein [Limnohabitans sp. INBF002]|jgi:branched-chain amino acid transport system ATP-binding protein|uniref:ABC transporter ATP-binding protein n=1 Tax=Limnohabitans sp. INBF002 TaxID=2986280 RepID=UPI002376DEE0|nr:ATP-binding cassette domain-containing protein [Limnohabitans sp. INBF002]BDU52608.1 ABC transporter ATP-binding protein [Limnohabitans sp. INBF002]